MTVGRLTAAGADASAGPSVLRNRWIQLAAGILGMVMIANLQYGWTLFVNPINEEHHWGLAAIQVAFSIFVVFETWLVPLEGYLVDRFGPTLIVGIGGVLVAAAWAINAEADSLTLLYVGGAIGGLGAGIVYGTAAGNALKWFPDRRGLAAGLTAAGFGAGAALTVAPIANMIRGESYESAFLVFGLVQGIGVLVAAAILRAPRAADVPASAPRLHQTLRDVRPTQMLRLPVFWLLYVMMTIVATGGLVATAQLGPIADDFGVGQVPVTIGWVTMAALPFALSLDRVMNGITRPITGWVSDRIGRAPTMTVMFAAQAVVIALLVLTASHPMLFVVFSGLAFFSWGEIFSLFPAISGDLFGRQYATTNYGLLYTAKGTAALLVPLGNIVQAATGSWLPIFGLAIVFNAAAAVLAAFVLPRVARAHLEQSAAEQSVTSAAVTPVLVTSGEEVALTA
jgi:MFS transporter, OFA family, oxalate/formate antiporter